MKINLRLIRKIITRSFLSGNFNMIDVHRLTIMKRIKKPLKKNILFTQRRKPSFEIMEQHYLKVKQKIEHEKFSFSFRTQTAT